MLTTAYLWISGHLIFISQTADMSFVHLISLLKINHRVGEHTLQLSSLFVMFNMIIILVHVFQVVGFFFGGGGFLVIFDVCFSFKTSLMFYFEALATTLASVTLG